MHVARPAFAIACAIVVLACSSSSATPAKPVDRDAAAIDTGRPDTQVAHCGAIEECNCKDGTNAVAGCEGPATCEEACANHQGLEPEGQCADGEAFCEGECVNLAVGSGSGYNCGACGVICPEYSACSDSTCKVSLPLDAGHFDCRADSDCPSGEACVLNANSNCPPFCAEPCRASDGGASDASPSCGCGAAIDVGTSAHLSVCFPAGGGC